MRRLPPLLAIFFTVFVDMLAFGMFVPDIQTRGESVGAQGWSLGLVLALFSIAQFIFLPLLGRLSDKSGRRIVLVTTTLLAAAAHLTYAFADNIWILSVSRVLAGLAGANLGVAFAYITDSTTPEKRARSMGVLGMAFGLGFIMGPPIGALLVAASHGSPFLLGLTGAVLALINCAFVVALLPEAGERKPAAMSTTLAHDVKIAFSTPALAYLLILFLAGNLAFANMQNTFFLLEQKHYGLTMREASMCLVVVGVIAVIMQGGVMRVLLPKYGEVKLLRFGYILQAPALVLMAFARPWGPLIATQVFIGIGAGMANPSLSSLVSKAAPKRIVGSIFGITQALGALARIIGPLIAVPLFYLASWAPYALAGALMLIPLVGAWKVRLGTNQGALEAPGTVS